MANPSFQQRTGCPDGVYPEVYFSFAELYHTSDKLLFIFGEFVNDACFEGQAR
jgi:hypothetical protein